MNIKIWTFPFYPPQERKNHFTKQNICSVSGKTTTDPHFTMLSFHFSTFFSLEGVRVRKPKTLEGKEVPSFSILVMLLTKPTIPSKKWRRKKNERSKNNAEPNLCLNPTKCPSQKSLGTMTKRWADFFFHNFQAYKKLNTNKQGKLWKPKSQSTNNTKKEQHWANPLLTLLFSQNKLTRLLHSLQMKSLQYHVYSIYMIWEE